MGESRRRVEAIAGGVALTLAVAAVLGAAARGWGGRGEEGQRPQPAQGPSSAPSPTATARAGRTPAPAPAGSTGAPRAQTAPAERRGEAPSAAVRSATVVRDASGRVTARVDGNGTRASLRYDHLGRPIGFQASELDESLRYDARGRLVEACAGGERLTWSFEDDADGQLHVRQADRGAGLELDYRCASGRQEVRTPFGATTWTQDAAGRLVSLETPAGVFTWAYDAAGGAVVRTAPNGVVTSYAWDAASRAERVSARGPAHAVLDLERAWSEAGRVESITRDGELATFEHDRQGRLNAVRAGPGAARELAYDDRGNRTADGATTVDHDAHDRLSRASDGRVFTHDAAGRLVRIAGPQGVDAFAYDAFGRLARVQRAGRPVVTYGYDGLGRIATRQVGAAVTRYVYDGPRLLAELGPGQRRRVYVHGPGLDEPLAYRDGEGEWTFLHADTLGHVLAYSDASGARVDALTFDPWGQLVVSPSGADRPVFFCGRLVDPVAGLVHLRARFYDPALGRFLTPDPAGPLGGPNAYSYVRNDPLGRCDPLGLWDEPPLWLRMMLAPVVDSLPSAGQEAVGHVVFTAWNLLDIDSREQLRELPRWELYAAGLDRKVSEIVRGYEPTAKEYLFLKGEVIGLGRGLAALVHAFPELGNFAVDLGATTFAAAHDTVTLFDESRSWLATYDPRSGLGLAFAHGKGLDLLGAALFGGPERIAEASRRTGILVEQGRYQEAGEVFGEVVLTEAALWLTLATGLANKGINVSRLTAAERQALVARARAIGYRPGVGDDVIEALAAYVRSKRGKAPPPAAPPRPAPGPASPSTQASTAPPPASAPPPRDGLVQALDPTAPRGATAGAQGGGATAVAEAPPPPKAVPPPERTAPAATPASPKPPRATDAPPPEARGPPFVDSKTVPPPEPPTRGPGRNADRARIESAPPERGIGEFENHVAESAHQSGERILGRGDSSTRRALDMPDIPAADVLSHKGGKYHIREVKESRGGGGADVDHAIEQMENTALYVRMKDPRALFGTMEISVPRGATVTGNWRFDGGIVKTAENGVWKPYRIGGRVVTVRYY